jgi:hypothetical protein
VEVNARGARLHNTVRNNVLSRNNREDVLRRPCGRLEVILSRFKTSLETSHNLWGWERVVGRRKHGRCSAVKKIQKL